MNTFNCAWQKIIEIIGGSEVPEDQRHAENTVEWLVRLRPNANLALLLAALGHDIDRATTKPIYHEAVDDHASFEAAHAEKSAALLEEIFSECGVEEKIAREACRLVRMHKVGGDPDADLLRDADSLSYFDVSLSSYYQREGYEETLRRCLWELRRLNPSAHKHIDEIAYSDTQLQQLVGHALQMMEQETKPDTQPFTQLSA